MRTVNEFWKWNKVDLKTKLIIANLCFLTGVSGYSQNNEGNISDRNRCVVDTVVKYGPKISPTYQTAVCTELVIKIIEKFYPLNKTDKSRIRIITKENVHTLLANNSSIPKGVYYALTVKGIGIPIDNIQDVQEGDFVQFRTDTWRHCGIVKSINNEAQTMELYSSFPSTNGYGIQLFNIPRYCYFVRLK